MNTREASNIRVPAVLAKLVAHPIVRASSGAMLCVLILAFNGLRLPFLWDDYDFLGRALSLQLKDLLPDPSIVFYRPISREAYFWLITHLLDTSPLAAHILNAIVAAAILVLLVSFVGRLAGATAGLLSALVFACSAVLPLEISWVSASQDLLCALFLLFALHLQLLRRPFLAALAMTAALLSKETALVAIPVIVVVALVRPQRSLREIKQSVMAQGTAALAWAMIHPWTRTLLSGPISDGGSSREYLAFRGTGLLPGMLRGAGITANFPWIAQTPEWPSHLILPAILASAVLCLLTLGQKPGQHSLRGIEGGLLVAILVGVMLMLGSLALTSMLLELWAPHYACIPALALSIAAGPILARGRALGSAGLLLAYLWLGIGVRGNSFEAMAPSERNLLESARSLQKVERGFKMLYPELPTSNVYVSVQARGSGGLYRHLFRFQPLRVWYKQPDIWVLDPNRRRPGALREYLFWIDPDLAVFEISLADFAPRGPSNEISLPRYQKTLRGYALGLAGAGEVDRAVYILTNMPETSRETWAFDQKIGVALLLAANRTGDAARLAARTPAFSKLQSIGGAVALLVEPITGLDLDRAAMQAFGLDPDDLPTLRLVMRNLEDIGSKAAAGRLAGRIQAIVPGDPESAAVLDRVKAHEPRAVLVPVPYDVPQ